MQSHEAITRPKLKMIKIDKSVESTREVDTNESSHAARRVRAAIMGRVWARTNADKEELNLFGERWAIMLSADLQSESEETQGEATSQIANEIEFMMGGIAEDPVLRLLWRSWLDLDDDSEIHRVEVKAFLEGSFEVWKADNSVIR